MNLTEDVVTQITHYSSLRNTAIHDQGLFDLALNESGHILHTQKACALRPTPLSMDAPQEAATAYEVLCTQVAKAVMVQVLKVEESQVRDLFEKKKSTSESVTQSHG